MAISQLADQSDVLDKSVVRTGVQPHNSRWRICQRVFWLSLMFIAGGIAGSAGTTILIERMRHEILTQPEQMADRLMFTVRHDLGSTLTASQERTIREIIDRHHARFMELHNEFHPLIMSEIDALEADMAKALTEEQRNIWLPRFRFVRQRMIP